ncbi:DNA translocase FtsK [Staphylococcus epidermidis]|uniref:DNA translocase FtsK n=1 Tax=Staphylococcus epidermidis TaxID=1282 RepID=UPI00024E5029|nr:DNA translocase FtsK [Staphylococcus epidermidis]EHR99894.1 FtsK/SpoIIIE family protein [Staphylococcus epidermidis VCU128]MCG1994687.1 DNA translocase FtsK [Staphylococcus epidermidis]MCG2168710.1 DNA translocase FtsK [Staphylococcus epidermidis]MCG2225267.1 DNA translocase FtsK [Staphylococcus epidermidis]MCG2256740.1 DNA translocase FtsK [Staphylococcus epidermidis]
MSWFDKLFGDDNGSNDDLLRKNKNRRQSQQSKQNNQDSLLPQNNDIYSRPRGKFRFPIQVSENEYTQKNESYNEHSQEETNDTMSSYNQHDNLDFVSSGKRHRRRRQVYSKHNQSKITQQKQFADNNYTNNNSVFNQNDNQKSSQQRKSIQSENIKNKANTKNTSTSPGFTYLNHSFKSSEVPSAIFGTKKRRPIENGVIPPEHKELNDKEIVQKDEGSHSTKSVDASINVSNSNDDNVEKNQQKKQQTTAQTESSSENIHNVEKSNYQTTKRKTPNYSKVDNTINIENIYASQIVEEIRRERERKVLQKRRFKKALQQKRQQNQQSEEDSIQKAIDEMYAKQAQHYTGESSLDLENESNQDSSPNSLEKQTNSSNIDNKEVKNNAPSFNYEEIDLDATTDVYKVNEEETESKIDEDLVSSNHYHSNDDSEVEDAEYHELDDNRQQNQSKSQEDIISSESINSNMDDNAISASVDNDTERAKPNEDKNDTEITHLDETTSAKVSDEKTKSNTNNYLEQDKNVKLKNVNSSKSSNSDTVQTRKQRFGGSRPFNVLMTPSDKKRMMDQKHKKISVPELTPERKANANHRKDRESNKSEEFKQINTNRKTDSNSNEANGIEHDINSASDNRVHETSSKQHDEQIQKLQDDFHFENPNHAKTNNSNETGNQSNISHSKRAQYSTNESENIDTQTSNSSTSNQNFQRIRKGPNIKLPSYQLLEEPEPHEKDQDWIDNKKQELNDALYYFNVPAEVKNVTEGPSVTRFELSVEKGVKVSRITALQDDIKMALAAKDIRIEAPIPGTSLVGIEVPNQNPTKVNLRSIIESPKFKNTESKLTVAMGYRINNEPLLMDIAKTPHALIAGATGSGKSVCINSILMSLLYKNHPEELRLLLIDPKMVELAPYNDLPHLVSPVITDVKAATQSLKWAVEEMEKRYKLFAQYHVRNITAFNKKAPYEQRMPKIVIVIDELADLMMMAPQDVEQSIARIAQKARACGIHMLVATQRPSVNVITGLIKANIPTRIAFMVSSNVDSRTILDSGGAERLLGYGDMLYLGSGMNKPIRVQGTFVSDDEIDEVVDFIKQQRDPEYLFEEKELLKKTQTQAQDDLFDDVCEFMVEEGHISTSLIQRHFQIGYNRAARIIDQLEQLGYISGANGSKPRDVYITEADLNKE